MTDRPWMPSNGTEGDIFDKLFCSDCVHDAAYRDGDYSAGCDILARGLGGFQPDEWVWNAAGSFGVCTAFEERKTR